MPNPSREITPEAAAEAKAADPEGYLILDCRLPEEFEIARVEGSVLIPLHELAERLDEVEEALEERGQNMTAPFAVLCHHGVRSLKAAVMLQGAGFAGARSVFGGIERWSRKVDRAIPEYHRKGTRCVLL